MSCVNSVGVDLNQASKELLTYVSGLGPQLARNIVAHRNASGPFRSRAQLRDVPRLGPKAFEQCAGFLRIRDGEHPLDASAVHPESYPVVEAMASDLGCHGRDLLLADAGCRSRIDIHRYVGPTVGLPTLQDILQELAKPGRDPRQGFELFAFAQGVSEMKDLSPGMRLPGVVTNVTAFGAFVDIGVHQDGLVHVSELADRFVRSPMDVVKVHQKVEVRVLSVDAERKRIALSMRKTPAEASPERHAAAVPKTVPAAPAPAASQRRLEKRAVQQPVCRAAEETLIGKRRAHAGGGPTGERSLGSGGRRGRRPHRPGAAGPGRGGAGGRRTGGRLPGR